MHTHRRFLSIHTELSLCCASRKSRNGVVIPHFWCINAGVGTLVFHLDYLHSRHSSLSAYRTTHDRSLVVDEEVNYVTLDFLYAGNNEEAAELLAVLRNE